MYIVNTIFKLCVKIPRLINISKERDHVERKEPKYKNHKLKERKVKTLTRNLRDRLRTGKHKQTETVSRYFDWHGRLSQSKESKYL